jgi:integrase
MEHIKKTAYTQPKIVHYDYDLSRVWFVYFRYHGKVYKHWAGINTHKSKAGRLKEAITTRNALIIALEKGWSPLKDEPKTKVETITKAVKGVLEVKRSFLRRKSVITHTHIINMFTGWLKDNNYDLLFPENFTPVLARSYLDYLIKDKKYAGKTHNGQLGILKTIFNAMVDREVIVKNPFKGIKEVKEEQGKNVAYTDEERLRIRDYLKEHNIRVYYAVQFVYYCFIRRSELIQLKVGDIDFENMTIRISSSISKNRKQESVTIPKSFEPILYEMGLDKAPKHYYIFGHRFMTCERRTVRADNLTESHRKALKALGITGKSFYSFKHTGCVNLYNSTKDIYLVSRQCRHYDISMTMRYMRSLGVIVDEKLRAAEFTF